MEEEEEGGGGGGGFTGEEAVFLVPPGKARDAFAKIRRELTEEELSQSGVHKLILKEIERLERSEGETNIFREQFYEADKTSAVLKEKLKGVKKFDIIYSLSIAVGATMLGLTPGLWGKEPYGYIVLGIGILLILISVVTKAPWRRDGNEY
ncbi:MAG TPA: hypothetical protein VMW93_04255 [bacterium]|nr:hypothetical protein [bacterium]